MSKGTRCDIEFAVVDGVKLRGWLYPTEPKAPTIILTHGFSGLKEQFLDEFGKRFQAAGFTALIYDNRNFGSSDGSPRFEIDPFKQMDDYHDAISYAATLPEVDPNRIAIWGSSYSGGNVIQVAAIDRRVKAVIAQVPFVSGEQQSALYGNLISHVLSDRAKMLHQTDEAPTYMPIIAETLEQAERGEATTVLNQPDAYQYFTNSAERWPTWENKMTIQSLFKFIKNEPQAFIHRISPTPFLMVVAEQDTTVLTSTQLAAYQLAREPKQLHLLRGYGHFDVYSGEAFELNITAQIDFLKKNV
ncbi:alpha beta superfamily hydrolase [Trichoderma arundinaceum]|uniref:Alpha beta superfamily hydrolase n=1 Tax=Trichoderma arundinaceum TaxID=490622 RepID=A0A395NZ81_TRIAR|nr:alpha beta superfamily hydrolase [Trichoderma arundinaceum]